MYSSVYHRASRLLEFRRGFSSANLERVSDELARLICKTSTDSGLQDLLMLWRSDCILLTGDLRRAIEAAPPHRLGRKTSFMSNRLLNLKMWASKRPSGVDLLGLIGPKGSTYGKEHLTELVDWINKEIDIDEEGCDGPSILITWSRQPSVSKFVTSVFNGAPAYHPDLVAALPRSHSFDSSADVQTHCEKLFRRAENKYRVSKGLPRVGEGWRSETELYYSLRQMFPEEVMIQHASPTWLGRQHLDIFFPERNVAIEFQGEQHFRPVAFFGGGSAYQRTIKRDRRKRQLCRSNGVRLIEVTHGYRLKDVFTLLCDS